MLRVIKAKDMSRKALIKDNTEMAGNIKWLGRVMDDQLAANVQLELNLSALQSDYDELVETLNREYEYEEGDNV